MSKIYGALLRGLISLLLILAVAQIAGIRVNLTASLPLGLYVETTQPTDYVSFCLDGWMGRMALQREYITPGTCSSGGIPLLKKIVARPGEVIHLSSAGLSVNGKLLSNTAPMYRDSRGRTMPIYPFGTYRVEQGTVWVASEYDRRSYDSRYIGGIPLSAIREHLKPFWTFS